MEGKIYPNITVVNEADEVVGYMDLMVAIKEGYIRRVACVLLFNDSGDILIQRRAAHVLSPNLLDYSAAGHVEEGDSYEMAARRELEEELRVIGLPLTPVVPPFKTKDFFSAVFTAIVPDSLVIVPDEAEVAEIFWMPYHEFKTEIESAAASTRFTYSLLEAWPHLRDRLPV